MLVQWQVMAFILASISSGVPPERPGTFAKATLRLALPAAPVGNVLKGLLLKTQQTSTPHRLTIPLAKGFGR